MPNRRALLTLGGRILVTALVGMVMGCGSRIAPSGWLATPEDITVSAYGGWVALSYREAGRRTAPPWPALITGASPRLRPTPSSKSRRSDLQDHVMVTVLARSLLDSGVWYRIETPEGKTGWVHASEITLLETEWGVSGEFIAADPDTLFVLAGRRLVAAPLHRIASVIVDAYEPQTGDLEAWTAIGALSTISHGYYLSLTLPLWILVGVSTTATENQAPITRFDDEVTIDDLRIFTRFPQGLPPNIDRSSLKPKPTPKE